MEGSGPPEARNLSASSTAESLSGLSIVEIERPSPLSETCNSSHKQQKAPAHSTRQLAQPGWGETRRTGTGKVAHGSLGMDIMSTMACFEPCTSYARSPFHRHRQLIQLKSAYKAKYHHHYLLRYVKHKYNLLCSQPLRLASIAIFI